MATFKPTRQTRLYEDVASQLREAILSGRFQPGDRLPVERELMAEFGVSRAVVRQATMNLEHEGLVDVQVGAGGGTFVRESGVDAVLHAFANLFRHRGVAVHDYLAAKRVLEPAMTAAVLAGSGPEHHRRLADNLQEFREAMNAGTDDREMFRLSLRFHELLVEATSNPVLESVIVAVIRLGERVPAFTTTARADWTRILAEHEELLDALRAGAGDRFSALILSHLATVGDIYDDVSRAPTS